MTQAQAEVSQEAQKDEQALVLALLSLLVIHLRKDLSKTDSVKLGAQLVEDVSTNMRSKQLSLQFPVVGIYSLDPRSTDGG